MCAFNGKSAFMKQKNQLKMPGKVKIGAFDYLIIQERREFADTCEAKGTASFENTRHIFSSAPCSRKRSGFPQCGQVGSPHIHRSFAIVTPFFSFRLCVQGLSF